VGDLIKTALPDNPMNLWFLLLFVAVFVRRSGRSCRRPAGSLSMTSPAAALKARVAERQRLHHNF